MKIIFNPSQKGLTLVELMISLALGMALMAGAMSMFMQNKQTFSFQEGLARLQENGRFALDTLTRGIRSSGFLGCSSATPSITNTLNSSAAVYDYSTGLQGYNYTSPDAWTPSLDATVAAYAPIDGPDVIIVRTALVGGNRVTAHPGGSPPGSANIQINAGCNNIKQFDVLMVSDCSDAAVFQVTSANPCGSGSIAHNLGLGTPGNATKALGKRYTGGEIIVTSNTVYFIKTGVSGLPSLWQAVNGGAATELVEGVEDMQILYGEDTNLNGTVDVAEGYIDASAVSNWNNVLSVRINLLLQTAKSNLLQNAQSYFFNGTTTTASDNRLRKAFTATIAIRNRMS